MTVGGDIDEGVTLTRATQMHETDLAFLHRVARNVAHGFNVRGNVLVFYRYADLESAQPVAVLDVSQVSTYDIQEKTVGTYTEARTAYANPDTQELLEAAGVADGGPDVLQIRAPIKAAKEAEARAAAELSRANLDRVALTCVMPGNTAVLAGNNIRVTGLGRLSGLWHVVESRHSVTPAGGYQTTAQMRRVGA
jgi:phage protein D